MRLTFEKFDARGLCYVPIVDQDTGNEVGVIQAGGVGFAGCGGIHVQLFGGKYSAFFNRYDECVGFVRGVQAVLNHLTNHLTDLSYPPERLARKPAA